MQTLGFAGLTHLGLISGAAALEKGNNVTYFSQDRSLIEQLQKGCFPIHEPHFIETVQRNRERVTFTHNVHELEKCNILYLSPDIPTDEHGKSDLSPLIDLIDLTKECWPQEGSTVILSQVPPGFTRKVFYDLREEGSLRGRLFYQVETLVFGIAMQRALHPERYIVGCADEKISISKEMEMYLGSFDCPVLPMVYESAEFCKICINAFLAASVSTTNILEEISQKIGAKWSEIAPALRLDKRIGMHAYLNPGLGISGGNIERDLRSIVTLSKMKGTESKSVSGFLDNSSYRKNWPLRIFYEDVLPKFTQQPHLGFLGIAYKENTHSIKNSPSVNLMSKLVTFSGSAFDPEVKSLPSFLTNVCVQESVEEVLKAAEVLFIMTPWCQFKEIEKTLIEREKKLKAIVDPYGMLKSIARGLGIDYYAFC